MSHLPLGYSTFDDDNSEKNKGSQRTQSRSATRRRKIRSSKAQNFLNSMDSDGTDKARNRKEVEGLANFEPMEPAKLTRDRTQTSDEKDRIPPKDQQEAARDEPVTDEGFQQLPSDALNQQYYNQFVQNYGGTRQYVPYYPQLTQEQRGPGSDNKLMKKLNYMIHLLEEQKDDQTQGVTEELVLYVFLGVFVIFVVDSFARAAKYTR